MSQIRLSVLATQLSTNASAVATAASGGVTADNINNLAGLLRGLANRTAYFTALYKLSESTTSAGAHSGDLLPG